jgi:hypothetical protein
VTRWGPPDERWILKRMPRAPWRPWPLRWLQIGAAALAVLCITVSLVMW